MTAARRITRATLRVYQWIVTVLGRRYDLTGLVVALNVFWVSLTPSLMPRDWYWQALVSGVLVVIGYALGIVMHLAYRAVIPWRIPRRWAARLGIALIVTADLSTFYWLAVNVRWQQSVYALSGFPDPRTGAMVVVAETVAMVGMTVAVSWAILSLIRVLARLTRMLWAFLRHRRIIRSLPPILGSALSLVAIALVVVAAFDTGVRPVVLNFVDGFYTARNDRPADDVQQATNPLRSGSPDSIVSWDSLGWPGKEFVSSGPTLAQLRMFSEGAPVKDPIRVYVGKKFSDNIAEQSRVALKELERTGAFDRKAIQVVVVTGTGWVDTKSNRPLEYILHGDVATVAVQYSYLPSALSLVFDRDRVAEAAGDLIRSVKQGIDEHVAAGGSRPELYIFGESLGSYGIERAFPDVSQLTDDTDGVLLAGPPGFNPVHQQLTARRDDSVEPCLDAGVPVVFAQRPEDITACGPGTRLLYLQNPTDPIVKWQPSLIWKQPEWVATEKRQGLLSPYFSWQFGVTYVQMTLDMLISSWAPEQYGHNYGASAVRAWLQLTGVTWDDRRIALLESTLQ